MRKVVCFALFALSAVAADTGARHELFPRVPSGVLSGFAEVWTSPGQVGIRVQIEDALENWEYGIFVNGRIAGFFETNDRGRGVGGGFVAVDPAWDADGDGVIKVEVLLCPNESIVWQLKSEAFDVKLR